MTEFGNRTSSVDENINERVLPTVKGYPIVLAKNSDAPFAAGMFDMDFKTPPLLLEIMQQRLEHL